MNLEVRQAGLDDTGAISALFCARIPVWQRRNAQGQVENVAYDALTIYERWLHGGPWMSIETCAILLNHLLSGGGDPAGGAAARADCRLCRSLSQRRAGTVRAVAAHRPLDRAGRGSRAGAARRLGRAGESAQVPARDGDARRRLRRSTAVATRSNRSASCAATASRHDRGRFFIARSSTSTLTPPRSTAG